MPTAAHTALSFCAYGFVSTVADKKRTNGGSCCCGTVVAAACPVAALSTTLSTAALDKHPQSKERGITLDLGFSAFTVSHKILFSLYLLPR